MAVQRRMGTQDLVMSIASKIVRPFMPDQQRDFFSSLPFLVVAARDDRGKMWSTLLFSADAQTVDSFITSPDPTHLIIHSHPLRGDALEDAMKPGSDLGILGIEFTTRRRNRVNGRLSDSVRGKGRLEIQVGQSFGNCPQYIKPRKWWSRSFDDKQDECQVEKDSTVPRTSKRTSQYLSRDQVGYIQQAETIFVATGYRGEGEDPRFGNDASHRGGSAGFLKVMDDWKTLLLPDYSGNNYFNTLGNLEMDPRMGITIPLYETGGMIQLTGTAIVDWDQAKAAANFAGAKSIIHFSIDEIVELPSGSLPIRWESQDQRQLHLQVMRKVKESSDVTSFYLSTIPGEPPGLPLFQAGQYLPILIPVGNNEIATRTYSLSSSNATNDYFRISVKREPLGLVSRLLHDELREGDTLTCQKPTGDFVYNHSSAAPVVFLSAGVGVTPILSMLYKFVDSLESSPRKGYWVHSARDGKHHPFQDEVQRLADRTGGMLNVHIAYTQPMEEDVNYTSSSRIDINLLSRLVPDLHAAEFYMCGPGGFTVEIETSLVAAGVKASSIKVETF